MLTAQGDQPSDVSAANKVAVVPTQKPRRERVPFCDGDTSVPRRFHQAFACRRQFDTTGEQTKSRACQTESS